jgi:PhoPQ-activated pathogenicity-related protein
MTRFVLLFVSVPLLLSPATHPPLSYFFSPCLFIQDVLIAAILSVETKSIVSVLWQVPNEQCTFWRWPGVEKGEDELVAASWKMFLESNPRDPTWVSLFPMVKSVVRAVDSMFAWAAQKKLATFTHYMVAGASKRGWTTWLTVRFFILS